jgi:hypothetical protein
VFIPYCTGDAHAGNSVRTFEYQYDASGPTYQYEFHFAGATNMDRYLERIYATRPHAQRIWFIGSSAGGFGATFNFERVQSRFPAADVAMLADSFPFVDAPLHWAEWRDTWNLPLPAGCADCDAGFPRVMEHLANAYPNRRMALLAFDHDRIVSYYLYGGLGLSDAISPPTGYFNARLLDLEALYDRTSRTSWSRASSTS